MFVTEIKINIMKNNQKIKLLEKMLKAYKEGETDFMCNFYDVMTDWSEGSLFDDIPEMFQFKPEDEEFAWFEDTEEYVPARIEIIKKTIKVIQKATK